MELRRTVPGIKIIGLDSIALEDPQTPPQTRDYLEKIGASARHLLGLINDILDFSKNIVDLAL